MSDMCSFTIEGGYDDDLVEDYEEQRTTAPEPVKCDECGDAIVVGQPCTRASGVYGGKPKTYWFCAPCMEIVHEFVEGARVFGALEEEFCLNWDAGAPLQACLNRVSSVAAKTKLHRWWLHWKGLSDVSASTSVPAEGDR